MKLVIDTDQEILSIEETDQRRSIPLYSKDAFEIISNQWLKVGWNEKYPYTFSWMGRPIIQLPEDIIRAQEVIFSIKPDVIIETGVAHGGSLVFYASLCKSMEKGRVIGIDIEIRPHNRKALEEHMLSDYISLIEGSSIDPAVIDQLRPTIRPDEIVMVILDSNHTRDHVAAELNAYHGFVTPGSYIVATDGSMQDLYDVPRGQADWELNNPKVAAEEFLQHHPEFSIEQPQWPFNESELTSNITHWPGAWLRKK